jgi:RimJ/RimL family protein N-acetyltransferase
VSAVLAPELRSARLVLRGHDRDDFAESAAMWADAEVTRYIGGRPFTNEECWTRLLRYVGHWALLGFGYWVVREAATGRFIGEVGLADLQRDLSPGFAGAPELGWALAPWAHGRGFATEAVGTVLGWGARHFGAGTRVVCMIDPGNGPSLRVAAKCGFVEYARASYKGADAILMERSAGS